MKQASTNTSRNQEQGAVQIFILSAATVIFGITAFAIDLGFAYWEQRKIAFAADASALAGVKALTDGGTLTEIRETAKRVALANGLADNAEIVAGTDIVIGSYDGSTLIPQNDPANANAVEVNTNRTVSSIFAKAIGVANLFPKAKALAMINMTSASNCVKPFALEDLNFPGVEIPETGEAPLEFDPPLTLSTGQNAPGNWGKVDIPDENGEPVNMSGSPMFEAYMSGGLCGGTMTIGDPYEGGTGAAALANVLAPLIGEEITMLVVSPFSNGASAPITLLGYATGMITGTSGNGANFQVDMEISSIRTDLGDSEVIDSTNPRILMY